MLINTKEGVENVQNPIHVPFNESTTHIYQAFIKVAKEIAERNKIECNLEKDSV